MGPKEGGKNFGWGARDMDTAAEYALNNAAQQGAISGLTQDKYESSFSQFTEFLRENGIKDLNKVEQSHVEAYGEAVQARVEAGDITSKTGQQLISNVNSTLEIMSGNKDLHISPSEYAGSVSNIATEARHNSETAWQEARDGWAQSENGSRLEVMSQLQHEFGLRFEESAKLDAGRALEDLRETGKIEIDCGTKGGQSREITPLDSDRAEAILEKAASLQGDHYSMIPANMTYFEFHKEAYDAIRDTDFQHHANRHEYACERYEQITGFSAPVNYEGEAPFHAAMAEHLGISAEEARDLDREARMEISEDLGHHRIDVTNSYLGSSYA